MKYPTRGRPAWFMKTLDLWIRMLSGNHECKFLIAMDLDDETMNTDLIKDYLCQINDLRPRENTEVSWYYQAHANKGDALNSGLADKEFDILIPMSDDVEPKIIDYDEIIVKCMNESWSDLDGVITFRCGRGPSKLVAIPIFGVNFYKEIGYLSHPEYIAFGDKELSDHLRRTDKVRFYPQLLLQHCLGIYGVRDSTYMRNARHKLTDARTYKRLQIKRAALPDLIQDFVI